MPLIRCSEQKRLTLERFYKEFIPDKINTFADYGTPMLKVLQIINETFKETTIYGLTSHATLLLLNEDSSLSPWFVALNALEDEYYIEYLMPSEKEPWPNAKVKGATKSIDELRNFLIIAMTECKGWIENKELIRIYNDLKK
jgi:hypothetical protein